MNMPLMKAEPATVTPATTAKVLPLPPKRPALATRTRMVLGKVAERVVPPVVVIAVALLIWELLCRRAGSTLPPPSRVLSDTWELIIDPFFQVLRTVPPLAWLPLSLAAFRNGQPSAIFVIFITAIWPIIINTAVGIRNIPQDYRNVAQVLRLNHLEFFWKIMVPSAAPYIFTGLRIGIGLSWLAIVAAEMLIGGVGIGFFIWDAWNSSRLSDIILSLVYVVVIGFVLDRIVAGISTAVTHGTAANEERSRHDVLSQA